MKLSVTGRATGCLCAVFAILAAFAMRMLEWPHWQNPEYRLGGELLLATHDAYHWLAGAEGFGLGVGHPMAEILRVASAFPGVSPAAAAFWAPPAMASLAAGVVFFWTWALSGKGAGIAAALIFSLSPGFLARTLLGYYDTDLITLFIPLLLTLAPALWALRFLLRPRLSPRLWPLFAKPPRPPFESRQSPANPLSSYWLVTLAGSGLLTWATSGWHSVFPYLIHYNVVLIIAMALIMAPRTRRSALFACALTYALPALGGWLYLVWPLALAMNSRAPRKTTFPLSLPCLVCLGFLCAWLFVRGDIYDIIVNHAGAYLKRAGDIHSSGAAALVYPSAAQSIIEVQDLSLAALLPYFHPWLEAAAVGAFGFIIVIIKRPAALFLLPFAALAIASSKLGGRMVMFGAPIMAIGVSAPCYWLLAKLFRSRATLAGIVTCVLLCGLLVAPFLDMIPALSQGPSINRRHAAALAQARLITPADATLWLWWDWGYAAHYFARRATIADGAQHGGPSLYLPAAVFASETPRFARQIIRRASLRNSEPGAFFTNMDARKAQTLIDELRSPQTPLEPGKGRQFVIVSFEMLRLGFWISNFGSWNFITKQGEGGALSIVPQALSYKLNSGEVRLEGSASVIYPSSITVFAETGLISRDYAREWFAAHPRADAAEQAAWLSTRRNVNFLFNQVTGEKLAMDATLYQSLMTRLLICDPRDPALSPYFRLVFDNVFARIYEVLPIPPERDAS